MGILSAINEFYANWWQKIRLHIQVVRLNKLRWQHVVCLVINCGAVAVMKSKQPLLRASVFISILMQLALMWDRIRFDITYCKRNRWGVFAANKCWRSCSSQTNCQEENKRCYFFSHASLHNSSRSRKVNIHSWQLRQNAKMRGERGGPATAGAGESGTAASLYATFSAHSRSERAAERP